MSRGQPKRAKGIHWNILNQAKSNSTRLQESPNGDGENDQHRIDFSSILVQLLIVSLVAGLTYAFSINTSFTFVDTYISGPLASKIRETNFWNELLLQGLLNPLSQPWLKASFAQDLTYSSPSASGFRLINLSLHILSCIYLYIFTFRIGRHFNSEAANRKKKSSEKSLYSIAFVASLLFACHPMTSQSVAYIAGRGGVLVGVNLILALNFFLMGFWSNRAFPILTGYLGSFIFSVMAIETSPEGLAAPLLLLLAAALLHSTSPEKDALKDVLKERKAELITLSALAIFVTLAALKLPASNEFANNFGMPPLTHEGFVLSQLREFLFYYLRCSIVPVGLSIEPPCFINPNFAAIANLIGGAAFLGLGYLVWRKREAPLLGFPLGAIWIAYLPSLLIMRSECGSDERFYFPLAMMCVLVANAARGFAQKNPRIFIGSAVFLAILLSSLTIWRELAWSSTLNIWKNADNLERTNHSRGMVDLYEVEGADAEKAKYDAEALLKKNPDCQPAVFTLAKYYFLRRDYLDAKPLLLRALKLCDEQHLNNFTRYQCSVACLHALVAHEEVALPQEPMMYLLQNYPESDEVNYLAGQFALSQNRPMLAVGYLNKAFSFDKKNPDYALALGQACLDSEDPTLIRNAYRTMRPMSHRIPSARLRLLFGQAALEVGRPDECLTAMDQTIAMFETSKESITPAARGKCQYLKSLALTQLGKKTESENSKQQALKLDPAVATRVRIKIVKNRQ